MNIGNGAGAFTEGDKRHFFLKAYLASSLAFFGVKSVVESDVGCGELWTELNLFHQSSINYIYQE